MKRQKDHLMIKRSAPELSNHAHPKLSRDILNVLKTENEINMQDLMRETGAKRGTLKDHLKKLVDSDEIKQHGKGRGTFYTL